MTKPTNTGCKNITYREKMNDYFVQILRNHTQFNQSFNTLEDAIDARDKALKFHEDHGRLPAAKEIGLRRREHRRKNAIGERYISLENEYRKRPYRLSMTKNGVYFVKFLATLEDAIKARDEVLRFFYEFDRLPNRKEQETLFGCKLKNRKKYTSLNRSKSNTRTMNISFNKALDRYMIQLTRRQQKFSAISHTLEEAVAIRDYVLKFYEDHGCLPTMQDYRASLKKGTNL